MPINTLYIIEKYYNPDSYLYKLLVNHGRSVAKKALEIAHELHYLNPDCELIEESAMLHDIGVFKTYMPALQCFGNFPYICHGYLGRELLESEGLPKHALICERHVGMGIALEEIKKKALPLPLRDAVPISLEEKIICFADKFFSKNDRWLYTPKPISQIKAMLAKYGEDKVKLFDEWLAFFQREKS